MFNPYKHQNTLGLSFLDKSSYSSLGNSFQLFLANWQQSILGEEKIFYKDYIFLCN